MLFPNGWLRLMVSLSLLALDWSIVFWTGCQFRFPGCCHRTTIEATASLRLPPLFQLLQPLFEAVKPFEQLFENAQDSLARFDGRIADMLPSQTRVQLRLLGLQRDETLLRVR